MTVKDLPLRWLSDDLHMLESQELRRRLRRVEEKEKGRLTLEGRSLVNFSSNDYLGFSSHPLVLKESKAAIDRWGVGATASRLISGSVRVHEELERELARYLGREAALVLPSGYMANLAVVTTLVGSGDAVIVDRLSHASLIDAVRLSGARLLVYAHNDLQGAARALKRAKSYRRRLLISDSLFSMDGDFAPIEGLVELAHQFDSLSLFDEAHALGVWPLRAGGADVVVGTLSKALGSQGGFVAGSRVLIDALINRARSFIFTTGLSPACVGAAQAALRLVQEQDGRAERVRGLSKRLREGLLLQGRDILNSESQIVPVLLGSADRALSVSSGLLEAGYFAPAIRPPAVHAGECRIRFSVTAEHSEGDIDGLLAAMGAFI